MLGLGPAKRISDGEDRIRVCLKVYQVVEKPLKLFWILGIHTVHHPLIKPENALKSVDVGVVIPRLGDANSD